MANNDLERLQELYDEVDKIGSCDYQIHGLEEQIKTIEKTEEKHSRSYEMEARKKHYGKMKKINAVLIPIVEVLLIALMFVSFLALNGQLAARYVTNPIPYYIFHGIACFAMMVGCPYLLNWVERG